ncbi:hypothetical protein PR370_07310 [Mycobacterium marinum]|uniref:hypothetical protein n=1 Tax=Mycobacterium marinum TaxID=1781 RepID=UPI00235979F4|nr:hypothetical protein [Mycobacterium marinum]MDC8980968.1 hypothetical protein [Mycobacterium marinum]MDC8999278.1 hypothetical protein [Mycobacterium marinum]MDC9009849.1 hypothetical protein [Mycobacterium marinum]
MLGQEESTTTWHRWLAQYGGMQANDAKRLKDLEAENAAALGMAKDGQLARRSGWQVNDKASAGSAATTDADFTPC